RLGAARRERGLQVLGRRPEQAANLLEGAGLALGRRQRPALGPFVAGRDLRLPDRLGVGESGRALVLHGGHAAHHRSRRRRRSTPPLWGESRAPAPPHREAWTDAMKTLPRGLEPEAAETTRRRPFAQACRAGRPGSRLPS